MKRIPSEWIYWIESRNGWGLSRSLGKDKPFNFHEENMNKENLHLWTSNQGMPAKLSDLEFAW